MRRRNILALLMAAALCLCLLAGCGSAETTDSTGTSITEATTIADLKGMKIAAQAGTFHADALNQIENVQGSTYPEFADLLTALKSGAIDGYIAEEPTAFSVCQSDDTLTFLPFMNNETGFTATASDVGIAIGLKKGSELREQINAVLAEITPEQRSALMEQIVTLSSGGEVTEFAVIAEEKTRRARSASAWSARMSRITGPTSPAPPSARCPSPARARMAFTPTATTCRSQSMSRRVSA